MPNVNQILAFATGAQARVLSPAAYAALSARVNGFVAGPADEVQLNTIWRQSSFVSAMIGEFVRIRGQVDVLDNGDIATFESNFEAALAAVVAANLPSVGPQVGDLTAAQRFGVFLNSGAYTIRSKTVKIVYVGGGGGGNTTYGAGAGASAVGYLTGLTIGATLNVSIGAGGQGSTSNTGGSNGGDTVISSGTFSLAQALTAGGGKAPVAGSGVAGYGGVASGGQILMQGNGGSTGIGGIAQPFGPFGNGGSPAMTGVLINGVTIANQNGAQGIVVFEAMP